jgi:hypothetical protein
LDPLEGRRSARDHRVGYVMPLITHMQYDVEVKNLLSPKILLVKRGDYMKIYTRVICGPDRRGTRRRCQATPCRRSW